MKEQLFKTRETEDAIKEMLANGWTICSIFEGNHTSIGYFTVVYEAEIPKEFEYKVVTNFVDLESLGTKGFELCKIDKSEGITKYIFRKEKL